MNSLVLRTLSRRYHDARNPGNFASLANPRQADASFEPSTENANALVYASRVYVAVSVALCKLLHFRLAEYPYGTCWPRATKDTFLSRDINPKRSKAGDKTIPTFGLSFEALSGFDCPQTCGPVHHVNKATFPECTDS
jgi:hypothetical protein